MSGVNLPLSGPVNFAPWLGQFTVNLGQSSNDNIEKAVIDQVASYGRQLGRIGDALIVLLKHARLDNLPAHEARIVQDLENMLNEIANVKERHGGRGVHRP